MDGMWFRPPSEKVTDLPLTKGRFTFSFGPIVLRAISLQIANLCFAKRHGHLDVFLLTQNVANDSFYSRQFSPMQHEGILLALNAELKLFGFGRASRLYLVKACEEKALEQVVDSTPVKQRMTICTSKSFAFVAVGERFALLALAV